MAELYIHENGEIFSIYNDDFHWENFGKCTVKRMSNVEYKEEAQGWEITFINGKIFPIIFTCRENALNAEIRFINLNFDTFAEYLIKE